MLTEVLKTNSVQKLMGILKERYGMGLKLASVVRASEADASGMLSQVKAGALHIAIGARGKYLATAILSKVEKLSAEQQSSIAEMVRLVLEPTLYAFYLENEEKNSLHSNSILEGKNVMSIGQHDFPTERTANLLDEKQFSSSLLLLESYNPQTISRVALHIHETGKRWAFLNYSDIKESVNTIQDLRDMGPMTLFVADILQLSPREQDLLLNFAKDSNPANEPLILIGCATPWKELLSNELIALEFISSFEKCRLELDRFPKDFSSLSEALELALDRTAMLI